MSMTAESHEEPAAVPFAEMWAHCQSVLEFNNSKIREIDHKAQFLSGISTILFYVLGSAMFASTDGFAWYNYVGGIVAISALAVSFVYAILVVIPSTKSKHVQYAEPRNSYFANWITSEDRESYRDRVLGLGEAEMLEDALNEVYTLAQILTEKYERVRTSSKALVVALALLVAHLLLLVVPQMVWVKLK
jgi:hypothetical protein